MTHFPILAPNRLDAFLGGIKPVGHRRNRSRHELPYVLRGYDCWHQTLSPHLSLPLINETQEAWKRDINQSRILSKNEYGCTYYST